MRIRIYTFCREKEAIIWFDLNRDANRILFRKRRWEDDEDDWGRYCKQFVMHFVHKLNNAIVKRF